MRTVTSRAAVASFAYVVLACATLLALPGTSANRLRRQLERHRDHDGRELRLILSLSPGRHQRASGLEHGGGHIGARYAGWQGVGDGTPG